MNVDGLTGIGRGLAGALLGCGALAALAACGREEAAPPAPQAQAALPASCDDPAAAVPLRTTANAPDWLLFAHQAGGGDILFNQRSIRRCAPNFAEITLQVRYARQQIYGTEGATYETIVRYNVERMRYRFDCTTQTFVVPERQIMGPNETVVATIPGNTTVPRPITPGTPAALIVNTACLGR